MGVAPPDSQRKLSRRVGIKVRYGALWCARGSISDFATLVRKSYSDAPSLVSTVVLLQRILYSASGLGIA